MSINNTESEFSQLHNYNSENKSISILENDDNISDIFESSERDGQYINSKNSISSTLSGLSTGFMLENDDKISSGIFESSEYIAEQNDEYINSENSISSSLSGFSYESYFPDMPCSTDKNRDDGGNSDVKLGINKYMNTISLYCKKNLYVGNFNTENITVVKVNGNSSFNGSISVDNIIEKVRTISKDYDITPKNISSFYLITEICNPVYINIGKNGMNNFLSGTKICFKRSLKCIHDVYIRVPYNKEDSFNTKIEYYDGGILKEGKNSAYVINSKGGSVSFFYTGETWSIYEEFIGSL